MHPLPLTIAAHLAAHDIDLAGRPVLCGLSGGADSVALVCILQDLGYDVRAMHANFQLRGEESERDEQFVRAFCARRGIPLHLARFDTRAEAAAHDESIEMAARRLRYDWFGRLAAASGHAVICVAHHADDNVETMLLNLIRGAGLHGLCGMAWVNDRGIVRPLLGTSRAELLAYLAALGESFVTDSSNTDTRYRRNRIRHDLLPLLRDLNPAIDATLQTTMGHLREAEAAIDASPAADLYRRRRELQRYGFTMSQILQMEQAHDGAIATAGPYLLTRHRGELIVGRKPVTVPETVLRPAGLRSSLGPSPSEISAAAAGEPHSCIVETGPAALRFTAIEQPRSAVTSLTDRAVVHLDLRAVHGEVTVRSAAPGDRFQPFGLHGTKLVSDYLKDRRRSRIDKAAALVVCDEDGILWLVGETIAQRAAVVSDTHRVLTLTVTTGQ